MKKIIVLIFTCVLFNCAMVYETLDEFYYMQIGDGFELYYPEEDVVDTSCNTTMVMANITNWIISNIEYSSDGFIDSYASPKETFTTRQGDCEDIALLYINLVYIYTGEKVDMAFVNTKGEDTTPNRSVVEGGIINHAVVFYKGTCYGPTIPTRTYDTVMYVYTFDELF
jgi:hypothetical protein